MATIKQIDGRTIHQIQSGQVIIDLCSVVKELVENSIDAEATSIDVRFKNQGLDLIEIQDNGSGISPENYASIALKHHTSKLSSYSDIASLQTFGFRGEALASLCALSVLSVTTCQASEAPKGAKLSFESSGKLKGTSTVAAQKGTTVSVEKLFHNLPVRRRELERNIKREWHKVIALLNQYACIQTDLKFSVSQQPTKGKRIHLFSTRGNPSTRENIINIFGTKTMVALVSLDLTLEMQPSTVNKGFDIGTKAARASRDVHIVGHVSRPAHGEGRQTPDRQMFFVNGRPCGLPQFAKVFNEVYKSFNSSQNPFILADIQLDTDMYDVNVSPDKRSILLHDQNHLLDTLRESLTALFDSHDYSVPTSQLLRNRKSEATLSKATPATSKASSRPLALSDDSEAVQKSDNEEEDEDKSPVGEMPPGRARIMGTSRSLVKDGHGQNLISRWVERNTSNRPTHQQRSPSPAPGLAMGRVTQSEARSVEAGPKVTNTEELSEGSESEDDGKPRPVKDFNKRLAEFSNTTKRITKRVAIPSSPSSDDALNDDEPRVLAIQPIRLTQVDTSTGDHSSKPNKGDTPQPMTVTIGNHIISNPTGPPENPGRKAESSRPVGGTMITAQPKPSFGDRLTQLFSASTKEQDGTIVEESMSVDESDNEEESLDEPDQISNNHPTEKPKDWSRTEADIITISLKPRTKVTRRKTIEDPPSPFSDSVEARIVEEITREEAKIKDYEVRAESSISEQREQSFKSGVRKKDATFQTVQHLRIKEQSLRSRFASWIETAPENSNRTADEGVMDLNATDAEEKLSLAISKGDFGRMRVAGQFNLGFIIAVRPAKSDAEDELEISQNDELFIIDQHATDEKYNFERLQATTVVQSQRLVHPKRLELTALEEEIVMENLPAIEANGFKVHIDTSGKEPVGLRCQVLALPLSRETTFTLQDLEELISLLGEESSNSRHIPRPSKVRKMFAMRACRSSIMIGKPLTQSQMETLVRHMGELDKPWNCPHGRPTMRHLCKLQSWDSKRWKGDLQQEPILTWRSFAQGN